MCLAVNVMAKISGAPPFRLHFKQRVKWGLFLLQPNNSKHNKNSNSRSSTEVKRGPLDKMARTITALKCCNGHFDPSRQH